MEKDPRPEQPDRREPRADDYDDTETLPDVKVGRGAWQAASVAVAALALGIAIGTRRERSRSDTPDTTE